MNPIELYLATIIDVYPEKVKGGNIQYKYTIKYDDPSNGPDEHDVPPEDLWMREQES